MEGKDKIRRGKYVCLRFEFNLKEDRGVRYLGLIRLLDQRAVVRLPDPKLKTLGERVSINSIIESKDAIFDENRFSSVLKLRQGSLINGTKNIGGSVIPKEVTKEVVVQQPEPELRKSKRNRTLKNFGPEFQLYLFKGTKDEVSNQHSYCFNVEDDPKIFNEAMKSQDVAF
ncbi:hypothetical protein Tco_1514921 [Tanacetum coccineum]